MREKEARMSASFLSRVNGQIMFLADVGNTGETVGEGNELCLEILSLRCLQYI